MIRETKRKIYFTEYIPVSGGKQKDLSTPPFATVNAKTQTITFGKVCIEKVQMYGKFIKFLHNSRNIIGWNIVSTLNEGQLKSKVYRLVRPNAKSGIYVTTIGPLLKQLTINLEPRPYKCEVMKYKEISDILNRGNVTYFIKLSNKSLDADN